ncbi:MAG TPA: CarD family transcriptional regulator [Anaerolineales bacterium]
MMFNVGDRVVHPQHGVGEVVKLEDRAFGSGVTRRYYEVSIPGAGSTLWVPLEPAYGLRKLATKSEIKDCRKTLASRPSPLTDDARSRQSNLAERLKEGTIRVQCEVVRDLYAFGEHKSLYGSMAGFFRQTQNVLCEEWALVEGITLPEAVQEVTSLLEKSRNTVNKEKA